MQCAKRRTTSGSSWQVSEFETVANELDEDEACSGDSEGHNKQLKSLCRPYLLSAGIEEGINFIFCMNPLMCSLLAKAEFIEANITYNEYKYLLNIAAFDKTTMEWAAVSRVRMDKEGGNGYCLGFTKTFGH